MATPLAAGTIVPDSTPAAIVRYARLSLPRLAYRMTPLAAHMASNKSIGADQYLSF